MAIVNLLPAMAGAPAGIMRTACSGILAGIVVKEAVSAAAHAPVHAAAGIVKYGVPLFGLDGAKSASVLPDPTDPVRAPATVNAVEEVKVIVHWS